MKTCTSFKDRFLGLMFQKNITDEYFFPNCQSVHTFFMKVNIDIICIDKLGNIIKIYRNTPPYKIILTPKNTYGILETPANSPYQEQDIINYKKIEN